MTLGMAVLLTALPRAGSAQPPVPPAGPLPPLAVPCVCTPLVMNSNAAGTQTWFVRALGGPLDLAAFARSVNPFEQETVTIQVFDSGGGFVGGSTASYPPGQPPGSEVPAVVPTINALPGSVYRIVIATPGTPSTQSHFRIRAYGAETISTNSPSTPSFEEGPVRWRFHVAPGEPLSITVSTQNTPATATTLTYRWIDPAGAVAASAAVLVPDQTHPQVLSMASPAGGTWTLDIVDATDHYTLNKTVGADRGIYLDWASAGESGLTGTLTLDGVPNTLPVTLEIRDAVTGDLVATVGGVTDTFNGGKLRAGDYVIHVLVPPGIAPVADIPVRLVCDEFQSIQIPLEREPAFPLTVTLIGDGSGVVTSDPAGIDCGAACSASFDSGTVVTLTATPDAGSTFAGWTGACSGTGACVVTIDAAKSVGATFDLIANASISNRVWLDSDADGLQGFFDLVEISGVTVDLLDGTTDAVIATTTTAAGYSFTGLAAGSYKLRFTPPAGYGLTLKDAGPDTGDSDPDPTTFKTDAFTLAAGANDDSRDAGLVKADTTTTKTGPLTATIGGQIPYTITVKNNGPTAARNVRTTDVLPAGTTYVSSSNGCGNANGTVTCTIASLGNDETVTHTIVVTVNTPGPKTNTSTTTSDTPDPNGGDNSSSTTTTVDAKDAAISGISWIDSSLDGLANNLELMSPAMTVELLDSTGTSVLATTTTSDGLGDYAFAGLAAGTYRVRFILPAGYRFTLQDQGSTDTNDSDPDTTTGITGAIVLAASEINDTVDAGIVAVDPEDATISNRVWLDANGNGIQDAGEPGVPDVYVVLYRDDAGIFVSVAGRVTDAAGNYAFTGLAADTYKVQVNAPAGYRFTLKDAGPDITDSDVDPVAGVNFGITDAFTLAAGANDDTRDAGLTRIMHPITLLPPLGDGSGTVTCVECEAGTAADGATVTLMATPALGSRFVSWSGACTGQSGATCTITVTGPLSVGATFDREVYALTVLRAGTGSGTVTSDPVSIFCGAACSASFAHGTAVTLTATPAAGSTFAGWSGACTGTGACVVTMDGAREVTATFTLDRHLLTVSVVGGGDVASVPLGLSCGADCDELFDDGTVVLLGPTANTGWVFAGWSGACTGTGPCNVTMDAAKMVTATFVRIMHPITLLPPLGDGSGTVTCVECEAGTAADGATVTLMATPALGSRFVSWSGACTGQSGATCTITVTGPLSVGATFDREVYALTVLRAGTGSGTVTSDPVSIFCGAACSASFAHGTAVTLTATPEAGSIFAGWTGACLGMGPCSLTMEAAREVTATFTLDRHLLTVSVVGGGDVASVPLGLSCGADCDELFDDGTVVLLGPTANTGWVFAGWSGACTGTGPCNVTMDAAKMVTATFVRIMHPITLLPPLGDGSGTVTCVECEAGTAADGATVTLTATPALGSRFVSWSGACTGQSGATCTITVTGPLSVGATFDREVYALTVLRAGTGSGTVTSDPVSIFCGAACSASFAHGTAVTLTATPDATSSFAGWSGACSGTGTCSVTMDAAKTVTATFVRTRFPVTVSVIGDGGGVVTSAPAGIYCGASCTTTVELDAEITLTATPDLGSTFAGWSGACSGSGVCTVRVWEATQVTATFARTRFPVTVSVAGDGGGVVTSTPAGIDCGATCTTTVEFDAEITLTAAPEAGATFAGWSGSCAWQTGASCTITVTGPIIAGATFTRTRHPLTVSVVGGGDVASSPLGISCGADCDETFDDGVVVLLGPTPHAGWGFAGWSGACTGTGPCHVTMDAARTVTATFVLEQSMPGKMEGEGAVNGPGGPLRFHFNVQELVDSGDRGRLRVQVGTRQLSRFESTRLAVTFIDDPAFQPGRESRPIVDTAVVTGSGRWNGEDGYTFEARAADRGEPGHNDTFSIVIRSPLGAVVASVDGPLDSGNIQSERLNPRRD